MAPQLFFRILGMEIRGMAIHEEEYYNYLYKIILKQSNKDKIATSTYENVIEYFKLNEDYEKCSVLYEYIKDRKN